MLTILRFAGLRVVVYTNDHRPAHVHVIGHGCEAVFKLNCPLGPVVLWENYGFGRLELGRILQQLKAHLDKLCRKREEFMVSRDAFRAANERGRRLRKRTFPAIGARYDRQSGRVVVSLQSGIEISFLPADAEGLQNATPFQLREIEVTPSGLGIHFPKLDADLYLPALLEGALGSRKWMAAKLGAMGGKSKSVAKRRASRANGRLGGRPRKVRAS